MELRKIILALLVMVSFMMVGCKKGNKNKIVIAEVTHSPFYAPQYVAISEGFFEKYDLDVEIILTPGADKVMASLLSKDANIGLMGPEASIYVYNQGREDYAITFAQLTNKDGSFILGRENINNFDISMLNNSEIIAGRQGGMPLMVLEYILKTNNLSIGRNDKNANINVRSDIQFAAMSGAFIQGEGDYVSLFEPTASLVERQGYGYILASLGTLSGEIPYTCYHATKSYINKNSDKITKFTKAIYEAQQWVNNHSSREIAQSIHSFFIENTIDELTTYVQSYKAISAWAQNPVLNEQAYEKLVDIMIMAAEISTRPRYDVLVDNTFALKAIE